VENKTTFEKAITS